MLNFIIIFDKNAHFRPILVQMVINFIVLKRKVVSRVGGNTLDKEKCPFEVNCRKLPFQLNIFSNTQIFLVGFESKSSHIGTKFGIVNKNDSPRVKQTFLYLLETFIGQ